MNELELRQVLEAVSSGKTSVEEGVDILRSLPFEDLGWACIDHHRHLRKGFPEVIFGPGKTPEQIIKIATRIKENGGPVLVTRVDSDTAQRVRKAIDEIKYNPVARTLTWSSDKGLPKDESLAPVTVVTAGTSDIPASEEACVTLELMGQSVQRIYDVGVAGLHRLLDKIELLHKSRVVIVVAGMDGALPSLVGGMIKAPVIAVPTSVGYGATFQGLAPLLTMLNSCAPGVAVVNIDNGYGAAVIAAMINSN